MQRRRQDRGAGAAQQPLGVWVLVSAFVLHLQTVSAPAWMNNFFLGSLVVLLAVSGAVACSFASTVPMQARLARHLHQ